MASQTVFTDVTFLTASLFNHIIKEEVAIVLQSKISYYLTMKVHDGVRVLIIVYKNMEGLAPTSKILAHVNHINLYVLLINLMRKAPPSHDIQTCIIIMTYQMDFLFVWSKYQLAAAFLVMSTLILGR